MTIAGPLESAIDTDLGEQYYGNDEAIEQQLIDEIIAVIAEFIDRRFDEGRRPALRDAHAKDTGCVKGIFRINTSLPVELQHGIFNNARDYDAWIRFSDANSEVRNSRWPDARGMALKLADVDGPKLLVDDNCQDFIMVNHPSFFIDDLRRYRDTLKVFHSGGTVEQLWSFTRLNWKERWRAALTNFTSIANPLFSQYWSMTSYRLGLRAGPKTAIKFTAKPRLPIKPTFIDKWSTILAPGFSLKNELAGVLAEREMIFDFYLQRFRSSELTPVESSMQEWTEDVAPLEPVATIIIPQQDVNSAERNLFCENLSFNPWHGLAEHKPLGAVNRARRRIYQAISKQRHELNQK
jgi:catalase